jgi:hypothetical protein
MSTPYLPSTEKSDPAQPVWGLPLQPAGCSKCEQAFLVPAAQIGKPCPNCFQDNLEEQTAILTQQPPELLAPFALNHKSLLPIIQDFVKPVWLRPTDFTTENLLERSLPVYFPMWMVDSTITAGWQAEIGYDYQVKTSQESFQNGGWITHEKLERRVRYQPRAGKLHRRYHNITSPALSDHNRLMQRTGRYDLQKAFPFQPAQVHGAALRIPDVPPESAWPIAREKLEGRAAQDFAKAAGGQHYRSVVLHANYTDLNWTQLFLPLFVSYYTADDGQRCPVYINGQTGTISGVRFASQRKGCQWAGILAGVAALLVLFGLISFAAAVLLPPLTILGGMLVFLAFTALIAAVIPAVWPWQWNRKQPRE